MDWTGSVSCQNCVALNKKLELFELLKQKCCKTDDITKNFLLLKTSYEKSVKLLESKSKKLTEARTKLKDASKVDDSFKRKAAEFQLRLVSSENKCQDLAKDLEIEREKNNTLQQEKFSLDCLVEKKEIEIASLNIVSQQWEEKLSNEIKAQSTKTEKKIDGFKAEVQKLQDLNTELKKNLKSQGCFKKRHDKLREDIVDIFKDGIILSGEPLKRFKKLLNRLQENETAAKLEAILDTPSMTPDGTTSTDTGVFSGDEDVGCPSLGNDLEMSSDSDDDFENVPSQSNGAWPVPPSETCPTMSSPFEDRFPSLEPEAEFTPDTCNTNLSASSFNDSVNTLCPVSNDSTPEGTKASPEKKTDSLFAPPGGDASPSLKEQERNESYEISFDMASSLASEKCTGSDDMSSTKSDTEMPDSTVASPTSKSESTITNVTAPSSEEKVTEAVNTPTELGKSLKVLSKGQETLDLSEGLGASMTSKLDSKTTHITAPSSEEKVTEAVNTPSELEKTQKPLGEGQANSDLSEGLGVDVLNPPHAQPSESCQGSHVVKISSNSLGDEKKLVDEDTCATLPESGAEHSQDDEVQQDDMDLDTMLHEWSPPTPILPFSDDSCGFDGAQDLPRKIPLLVSVGTNTNIKHYVSRASSPIARCFMTTSSTSTDEDFKEEKSFKEASSSPPKSFCNKALSPMKIRCKNIGVMPIAELRRNVAVSPIKVKTTNSATSPMRSHLKEVGLSPVRWQKLGSATKPSDFDISEVETEQESWTREARMLQQTLEVLGINTGDLSGVVLDEALVEDLRKAMEMALRKTKDVPTRNHVPSKQLNTSFCSFDPCEFAEICNQQHYNLHLLAKAKRVETTLCSRERKRKPKLKRLTNSSRRQRSESELSLKEEVLEEDDSSQKKKLDNLLEDSRIVKSSSSNNHPHFENRANEESLTMRLAHKTQILKSTPYPLRVNEGRCIERIIVGQPRISAKDPKVQKSVGPETTNPPQSSPKNPKINNCVQPAVILSSESNVELSPCSIPEEENTSASCQLKNATSDAPNVDCKVIEKTSTIIETPSPDLASTCEPIFNDSESEDSLIIDENVSSPVPPEVPEEISEDTCNKPVCEKEESTVPAADHFVPPKPVRMSLRKRQQSTSSESSQAESPSDVRDNPVVPRRSPRMKKTRIAHGGANSNLESYKKGYLNFVKGESTIPCADGGSVKAQTKETSLSSKICDVEQSNCVENVASTSILNTQTSQRHVKRKAEEESVDEEIPKRTKLPLVASSSKAIDTEIEDSDISMECDADQSAGTENAKPRTIRSSLSARKPSKLQKMRSSVSKVHPMVQATKSAKTPEAEERLQDPLCQYMKSPKVPKLDSQVDSKTGEDSKDEDPKDEAAIIERLREKGTVRMAAAASGRTVQLIQVKPGTTRYQRVAANQSPAGQPPIKPVMRVARNQPLIRPADRVNAAGINAVTRPTRKSTDSVIPVSTNSSSNILDLIMGDSGQSTVAKTQEQTNAQSSGTKLSVQHKEERFESFLISNVDLKTSELNPLTSAFTELENASHPACIKRDLITTQVLVTRTLKEYVAAPAFTPAVLQKAVDALSAPNLCHILPVLVQKIVHIMDEDFDSAPLRVTNQRSNVPPLTPVQQQLVTLIVQLSSQHKHLEQLPHQVLRLLEYRVFRLGNTPEGERLAWCSKLYAAICRIYILRTQALIFCWDSLYALRGRSYYVVRAVMDVWPALFPINPSFDKACPNAQVLLHLLRSHTDDKRAPVDNSWLKRLLKSSGLQTLSINSSILASSIFSNITSGGPDTNVAALVLLAKREDENWTMRDVVRQKLLPALDSWRDGSLSNVAGERIIWILCSILRAIPPERNGNTSTTLMKLLINELLKPNTTLPPQMLEVLALGLALLSRHDIENVAFALASWNPNYGSSRGFSSRLLQYFTCLIKSGTRPVPWWRSIVVRFLKSKQGE